MRFYDPDNLRAVTGGRWIRPMTAPVILDGVRIDSRADLEDKLFVAVRGLTHDGHEFVHQAAAAGAGALLVDREVDGEQLPEGVGVLRVDDTRRAMGMLAAAYRQMLNRARVIAVTGSSGKTTTKRLIDAVLSTTLSGAAAPKSFNNDIGVPLTLLSARGSDRYVVVEIGTNAPGEIAQLASIAEPDIAVITCIGRSHLEGLGSVQAVAREKCTLLQFLRVDGEAILNADAPYIEDRDAVATSVQWFGESERADLRLTARGGLPGEWWFEVNGRARFRLGLPGRHNAVNALAAVAIGRSFGIDDARIGEALAAVRPDSMRMTQERITLESGHLAVFNDAYNANPDSVAAALETFAEVAADAARRIVVLGDMLELGEQAVDLHREIGPKVMEIDRQTSIDGLVLVGELAAHIADELGEEWESARVVKLVRADEAAGSMLSDMLMPGDAVLLKASRGMELERLIESMKRGFGGRSFA